MPETGAQSGVRSLLAKFENSNQPNVTSPPSRGRSPVGSDSPGSGRPLSKVRASFVAVERAAQSSPSGLRKESGRSDSPAPKSVGSEDADTALRSPVSLPPSNGLDVQKPADDPAPAAVQTDADQKQSTEGNYAPTVDNTSSESPSAKEPEPESNRLAPAAPVEKPQKQAPASKTVTKRPSNAQLAKSKPATSTTSRSPSTRPKSPAHPRASTPSTNAASERTAKPARQTSTAATRNTRIEPAKTVTQKPSRTILNTGSRPASRTSRDTAKPTPSPTAPNGKPGRVPGSTTTPAPSSTAKTGTRPSGTGTTTSNLNRKPSSLRNTTNGSQRETTPTASSVSKQPSRPSPPSQSSNERPGSRVSSAGSKPVDEGFLARMMRPTASSASKVHDKAEAKSPPGPSKTARAPTKAAPKTEKRPVHAKEKGTSEKTLKEKPQPEAMGQAVPKEPKDVQPVESANEEVRDPSADSPKMSEKSEGTVEKAAEGPIEQPSAEKSEPVVEAAQKAPAEPAESAPEPAVEAPEKEPAEKPVEPSEPAVEAVNEASTEPTKSAAKETGEETPVEKPVEPSEPARQDSGNEPRETPAPTATQAEEPVQQPENATEESANTAPSAQEHIPSISEPPVTEPAQPSNTPCYDTPEPKEHANRDYSAGSSVETSFVDTMETASPAADKPDEAGDVGKQENGEPIASATAN